MAKTILDIIYHEFETMDRKTGYSPGAGYCKSWAGYGSNDWQPHRQPRANEGYKDLVSRHSGYNGKVPTGLDKFAQFKSYPGGLKVGDFVYARYNSAGIWFFGKVVLIRDFEIHSFGVEVDCLGFNNPKINPNANVRRAQDTTFYTNCVQFGEPSEGCVNKNYYDYLTQS